MSSRLRTDLPFGPGNNAPTRRNEPRPVACVPEPETDHHERARLVADEAHALGWDLVVALHGAAALARELGRPEQAEAFEAEAARFVELPFEWSDGAPSEVRP